MWKLATLILFSSALTAGVIQVSPNEFEITTSVTGPAPTNGAGAFYNATFDVPFYYSGPTSGRLSVNIVYAFGGPGCSGTGFPSCDVGFSIGVNIDGLSTGAGFNLDTNDFGGDVGGSLSGTGTAVDGWNTAEVYVSLFLTGFGIQNVQAPFTAVVQIDSGFGTVSAIPEPSTWGLAALGVGAAFAWRRRTVSL